MANSCGQATHTHTQRGGKAKTKTKKTLKEQLYSSECFNTVIQKSIDYILHLTSYVENNLNVCYGRGVRAAEGNPKCLLEEQKSSISFLNLGHYICHK